MELTIEECQFLLNAVNAQAMSGFKDGLAGSQRAMIVASKLQQYASELANPPAIDGVPVSPADAQRQAKSDPANGKTKPA